jgi:hypothetical protein
MIYLCSCGFAKDDREWLDGHMFTYPAHQARLQPRTPAAGRGGQ